MINKNVDYKEIIGQKLSKYNLQINYPMKSVTSFHIGGEADFFVRPTSVSDIMEILNIAKDYSYPVFVMGNGSNLLVSDKGIRAIVIQLTDNFSNLTRIDDYTVEVDAGMSMTSLSKYFLEQSLEGFEFACGIPGTLGGAVTMNAGAYGSMMSKVVTEVIVLDKDIKDEVPDFFSRHKQYSGIKVDFLPIASLEKYLYSKLVRDKDKKLFILLDTYLFQKRPLLDILNQYQKEVKAKDNDGKSRQ